MVLVQSREAATAFDAKAALGFRDLGRGGSGCSAAAVDTAAERTEVLWVRSK